MLDIFFGGIMAIVLLAAIVILIAMDPPFENNQADECDDEPTTDNTDDEPTADYDNDHKTN